MNYILKGLLGFVLAVVLLLVSIYFLSRPDTELPARSEDSIRIATVNLLFTNPSPDEAADVLAHLDLDLLVLLEWTGRNLDEGRLSRLGYTKSVCETRRGTHGICVFYKAPLALEASIEVAPVEGPCNMPFAAIRLEGERPITIQAIHPPPPLQVCGDTNKKVLNYHASTIQQGRIYSPSGTLQDGDLAIVMGDFNALAQWERVQQFHEAGLVDVFQSYEAGLSPTWAPGLLIPDFARIDYIWASQELTIVDAWTVHVPGTDHRAIVADFKR